MHRCMRVAGEVYFLYASLSQPTARRYRCAARSW